MKEVGKKVPFLLQNKKLFLHKYLYILSNKIKIIIYILIF